MTQSRITESRRRFVEYISEHGVVPFSDLRDALVLKRSKRRLVQSGMNLATLYRIIEAFREKHLIHEVNVDGGRMILLCQSLEYANQQGIVIRVCEGCQHMEDIHFSPPPPVIRSEGIEYVETCPYCTKNET